MSGGHNVVQGRVCNRGEAIMSCTRVCIIINGLQVNLDFLRY